jgi:hypothetical protein
LEQKRLGDKMSKYVISIPDTVITEDKTIEEIAEERQALLDAKRAEILTKISNYRQQQKRQLEKGGPGPSAEFDIMKIVNEHNGEFIIVWEIRL